MYFSLFIVFLPPFAIIVAVIEALDECVKKDGLSEDKSSESQKYYINKAKKCGRVSFLSALPTLPEINL